MKYYGAVYRPPSEARSLIIQATLGCSNNTCAFCTMYKAKRFEIRPLEDVIADLAEISLEYPMLRKVFIADGDALIADTAYLLTLIETIYKLFPNCERVTSYATPRSLLLKTEEELQRIRQAGLTMLYMGLESGNDAVLKKMIKGNTAAEIIEAGRKARRTGFALSVTAITGLGGKELMRDHAIDTAKALSEMNPEYIGLLTLMVDNGTPLAKWVQEGSFQLLDTEEVMEEIQLTLQYLDSPGSIFRMNHASNYLSLKGVFNQDKEKLITQVEAARRHLDRLRPEYYRML